MWGTHGKPGSLSLGRHTGQDTGLSWHLPALDLPLLTEWAHAGPPELPPVCFEFLEQWRVTECPPPTSCWLAVQALGRCCYRYS